jgi:3-hydroxyisobutyrate dehydrogenase-like beta-hydroxyacid dehydrogenase
MINIAFIGLGTMGYPMAGHLADAGFKTTVYNRTKAKADNWLLTYNGTAAETPAQAAAQADIVLICAGRDQDVRDLMLGDKGILSSIQPGKLIIDHTTTSAHLAEELDNACRKRQVRFADAPVSGGQQGAQKGLLSLMVGCDEADFEEIRNVTTPYTKAIDRMGTSGFGQKTKMVNQICIAGLLQGLSEGIHFAQKNGLDVEKVVSVIAQGAAGSWQMQNRHETMIKGEYNHGFALDWMRKDLGICLEQANRSGTSLPVTALVDQFYADLQAMKCGREDTSALLKRLQILATVST